MKAQYWVLQQDEVDKTSIFRVNTAVIKGHLLY